MRFMVFMLPNIDLQNEADWMPTPEAVAEMSAFNNDLVKAGVMLTADGLHVQSEGKRIVFGGPGEHTVVDGPFTEAKEAIGGYWIWECKSQEEAVEWATRCPQDNCQLEIRQIFDVEEFPEDVQAAIQQP